MSEQLFVKGQRVCAKAPYQAQWRIGIITDVFLAPVTLQYVYVIGGEGYYASEVTEFVQESESEPVRCSGCNGFGRWYDGIHTFAVTCPTCNGSGDSAHPAEPQSLRVAP